MLVIDADNMVLGRVAAETAAILLRKKPIVLALNAQDGQTIEVRPHEHEMVYIVNAERTVVSGNPNRVTEHFMRRVHLKTNTNPRRGPFYPRTPEAIVKRSVRGMVKHRTATGKAVFKKLHVYTGIPEFLVNESRVCFRQARADRLSSRRINVGEIARRIGTYANRLK